MFFYIMLNILFQRWPRKMLKCFSGVCFLWAPSHRPENNNATREKVGQDIIRYEKHTEKKAVREARKESERKAGQLVCLCGKTGLKP